LEAKVLPGIDRINGDFKKSMEKNGQRQFSNCCSRRTLFDGRFQESNFYRPLSGDRTGESTVATRPSRPVAASEILEKQSFSVVIHRIEVLFAPVWWTMGWARLLYA